MGDGDKADAPREHGPCGVNETQAVPPMLRPAVLPESHSVRVWDEGFTRAHTPFTIIKVTPTMSARRAPSAMFRSMTPAP